MNKNMNTFSILLHEFLRAKVFQLGYSKTIKYINDELLNSFFCENNALSGINVKKIVKNMTNQSSKGLIVATCQSISITLYVICKLLKYEPKIVIGVRFVNGKIYAHSWIECVKGVFDTKFDKLCYLKIKEF